MFAQYLSFLILSFSFSTTAALAESADCQEQRQNLSDLAESIGQLQSPVEVRQELDQLAQGLRTCLTSSSEDIQQLKIGVWRQVFTDDPQANQNGKVNVDQARAYEVVLDTGAFYNLAEVSIPFGKLSVYLRGAYTPRKEVPKDWDVRFTDLHFRFGKLGTAEDMQQQVQQLERKEWFGAFAIPLLGRYPYGPVGASGTLVTAYIDEQYRIDYGSAGEGGRKNVFFLIRE